MSHTVLKERARVPGLGPGRWLLLVLCVLVSALIWSRPDAQLFTRDLIQAYVAPRTAVRPPIVLVPVTAQETGGADPDEADRRLYARAVDTLAALGASTIGIQPTLARPQDGDAALSEAIARSGRAVLAHGFAGDPWLEQRELVLPVQALGEPAAALGFLALTYDPDAVVRRVHLAFDAPPDPRAPPLLPSFPLALAQVHTRATTTTLTEHALELHVASGPPLRIPVQPAGDRTAWALFDPSLEFDRIPLAELARPASEVEALRPRVAGKIAVLVDATKGSSFRCRIGSVGAGMEHDVPWLWAAQVEAVLAERFVTDLKARLDPWFLLVFLFIGLALWTADARHAVARALLLIATWTAATIALARSGMLLDGIGLSLITIVTGTLSVLGRAFLDRRRMAALEHDLLQRLAALATRAPDTTPSPATPDVPAYLEPEFLARYLPEHYQRLEFLARGGMGVVYRSWDAERREMVALKVLDPRWRGDTNAIARFLGEIRAMQSLDHPSIVRVFDVRRTLLPFIAMELVEGRSLEDVVRTGGAPAGAVKDVGRRLTEALAYVHTHGIVHRDVKPSNVLWLPDGTVKLLDFGIARMLGSTSMTHTGDVLGSLPYMAPEQLDGRPAAPAADVYSLAVTVAALALGKPLERRGLVHLFPADELAARALPAELIALLERCFAEDASRRPADAVALSREFAAACGTAS